MPLMDQIEHYFGGKTILLNFGMTLHPCRNYRCLASDVNSATNPPTSMASSMRSRTSLTGALPHAGGQGVVHVQTHPSVPSSAPLVGEYLATPTIGGSLGGPIFGFGE
jgi:hypothetical protein